MVVLETNVGSSFAGRPNQIHNQVVISGLDAIARARAPFQPRFGFFIAGGHTFLSPNEAYAVRGTVYFMDGYGTVFRMGVNGKQEVVTQFLIGLDLEEVSFAVSPDGCQLAATLLDLRSGQLRTMMASSGSKAKLLHTWANSQNLVVVGWDSVGPIVVVGSSLVQPNDAYVGNPSFIGGYVAHLGGDGMPGPTATPPGCSAAQVSGSGAVTCYGRSSGNSWKISVVRTTGGTEVATQDAPPPDLYVPPYFAVGPNGLIAISGQRQVPGVWRGLNGAAGVLPVGFVPESWVDAQTIFGDITGPGGNVALVRIGGAQPAFEDLGFAGHFVGVLG
jgi:hypothetical protein